MGDYPKGMKPQSEYKKITESRKLDKIQRGKDWLQLLKDSGIPMEVSKSGRVVTFSDPKSYFKQYKTKFNQYKTKFYLKNGFWVRGLNVLGDPLNRTFTGGAEKFIEWYNNEKES